MKGYINILFIVVFKGLMITIVCISSKGQITRFYLAKIFVDDTLFTGNDDQFKEFSEKMNKEFEMSMFGEIKFFFGLQIQ